MGINMKGYLKLNNMSLLKKISWTSVGPVNSFVTSFNDKFRKRLHVSNNCGYIIELYNNSNNKTC